MKILERLFENAFVLETEPHIDHRGQFARFYCRDELRQIGHNKEIVQINYSVTRKRGAIRGMHFQYPPKCEVKLVKCVRGSVFDVIIDLRQDSPSILRWYGEVLSGENRKMMYVPEGFAHGFQTLEENSELLYLHTEYYRPEHEGGVLYNDPMINVTWPFSVTEISEKDQQYPLLSEKFEGILIK